MKMGHTKVYGKLCVFRYDEERTGDTRGGKGLHTVYGRCNQRTVADRKCFYPDKTHLTCPMSHLKKKKKKEVK
jgi:hypothetical protein